MKTIFINENDAAKKWFVIDANGKPLGRVAAKVASVLRGKEKVSFAPNQDCGDCVVVVNADKILVTGRKMENKLYHHHTGYIGGLKTVNYKDLVARHPESPLTLAVKGMLPKGPLGRKILSNLYVYAGENHPHQAQNPQVMDI